MAGNSASGDDAVTKCQGDDCESKCDALRREIDELINRNKHDPSIPNTGKGRHGLVHRFREMVSNMGRLGSNPSAEAIRAAQNHIDEIEKAQEKLADKLAQLKENGCGDPPNGAWSWAERPVKQFQDQVDAASSASRREILETGAKVGAGVGAGYIAYRVIRFLPSLFPPLWETIPANLAIP